MVEAEDNGGGNAEKSGRDVGEGLTRTLGWGQVSGWMKPGKGELGRGRVQRRGWGLGRWDSLRQKPLVPDSVK